MSENDSHYNGTADTGSGNNASAPQTAHHRPGGDYGLTTPLPDFEEGPPAYPGNMNTGNGNDSAAVPVIPLPNVGEGGPVYPGNTVGGSGNITVLPFPGTGGSGNSSSHNHGRPHIHAVGWPPIISAKPTIPSISPQYFGQVRFLNASANTFPVNISIDGASYSINSRFGTVSDYDWIADGFHTVTVRRASGLRSVLLQQNFPFVAGQKVTMVLTDSASGGLEMIRVIDTGCSTMPSNAGCYRFANMAYSGSRFDLLLYGGETVFRNVGFQTVTSYKQAVSGSYQFYITGANTYSFLRELPIIVIGASGTTSNVQEPLVSFQVDINAGQNYTSYFIGNSWSDLGMRVITLED
ncbi:MAG: DUF4397 domain-containing protein [Eubacteriales bacterium]|nr:DUF4397 domain-containing protein [Eubacteriales bacterium]